MGGHEGQGLPGGIRPSAAFESAQTSTLIKTSGTVRIRVGGRWRNLGGRYKLTRAPLVDARQGGVRVRLVVADNYTRTVTWGRLSGGLFKLGKTRSAGRQAIRASTRRAGRRPWLQGRSRTWAQSASPPPTAPSSRRFGMQVFPMAIRNRLVPASFTLSDRCDGSSVVQSRAVGSTSPTGEPAAPTCSRAGRLMWRAAERPGGDTPTQRSREQQWQRKPAVARGTPSSTTLRS